MSCGSECDGGRPLTGQATTSEMTSETTAHCEIPRLDQIDGEETSWLWPDRLPLGHVTVVAGEAGSGKSLLSAEIAARASNGEGWPDAPDKRPAGTVLIAHSDRHLNAVVKRRLLVAGADARRVAIVNRPTSCEAGLRLGEGLGGRGRAEEIITRPAFDQFELVDGDARGAGIAGGRQS